MAVTYQIPEDMAEAIEDILDSELGQNPGIELFTSENGAVAIVIHSSDGSDEWTGVDKVGYVADIIRSRGFTFDTVGNALIVRRQGF
jgi:hypothetical protein